MIANLSLFMWIPITVGLYLRLRPAAAAGASLLGAAILLPVGFGPDLPGLPPLSRQRVAALVLLALTIVRRPHILRDLRRHPGMVALAVVVVLTPLISALTNRDSYLDLHAMTLYDGYMVAIGRAMDLSIPFLLGLLLVRRREDLRSLLMLLAASAVVYSLLVLYEVRMAPVLHREVYGFLPHGSWAQTKRFGGWRPMVFTPHGIALARYLLMALLAAAFLHRSGRFVFGLRALFVTAYLAIVLVLAKSLGAILLAAILLPLALTLRANRLATVTIVLAAIVWTYPITRATGIFPTELLASAAESINPERSQSLGYRFFNEDLLLDHALERPLFGWGGWGRNRVYDPDTLKMLSTATDGYWIIILGYQGLIGFIGVFGALLIPPVRLAWQIGRVRPERGRLEAIGVALISTVYAIDLLPNGFEMSFVVFMCGGLAGALPSLVTAKRMRQRGATEPKRSAHVASGSILARTSPSAVSTLSSVEAGDKRLSSLLGTRTRKLGAPEE